ncbi:MAG: M24 family metallopeptidase [Gemmataceae bacterium]
MDHTARRRERVTRLIADEGLDALLVTGAYNVTYLTGFTGDSSAVVLTRDRAVLVSDPRYVGQLADECPELPTHIRLPTRKLHDALGDVLDGLGVKAVGCESANLTLADAAALRDAAPGVEWKPAADRVERLRMVKDDVELAEIRAAVRIAERAFAAMRALMRPEDTEKELADALEGYVRRGGGATSAFAPIVAVGHRAALPHCPPTGRRVRDAGLLLVDWGAMTPAGYRSDLTRVIDTHRTSASGTDTRAKLAEIHGVVLAAQQAAIEAVRPGATAAEVDRAARAVIERAGYGEQFGHGLGHGFGLQIHEAPFLRATSDAVIREGMVFTLEPGVYLPGWGGVRIEDDVLVTADGCEVLTGVPRDLGSLAF